MLHSKVSKRYARALLQWAGEKEKAIARSALREVEAIARREKNLDKFGKSTLSQAAVILDFGVQAQPVLLMNLKDKRKDWKVRFWVADILGYVGDEGSAGALWNMEKNLRERKEVRQRARLALRAIEKREKLTASRRSSRPSQ